MLIGECSVVILNLYDVNLKYFWVRIICWDVVIEGDTIIIDATVGN